MIRERGDAMYVKQLHLNLAGEAWIFRLLRIAARRASGYSRAQTRETPSVFALSTGRTGTRSLAALLGLSREILAFHEPLPLLYAYGKLAYYSQDLEPTRQALASGFVAARDGYLDACQRHGKIYVETSPQTTFLAPTIRYVLPRAKFIHVVRHPRAVIASAMKRQWYEMNADDPIRIVPAEGALEGQPWQDCDQGMKIAWLWAETNRWILDVLTALPPESFMQLRSEDLFEGNLDVLRKLFAFTEQEMPPERQISGILGKRLNAQRVGSCNHSQEWSVSIPKIVRSTASRLGYDW